MGRQDDAEQGASLFKRLNDRYGEEVNPWITLEGESPATIPMTRPAGESESPADASGAQTG